MNRRNFMQASVATALASAMPIRYVLAATGTVAEAIPAITGSGAATSIKGAALAELKAMLRGQLLLRGDDGYEASRRVMSEGINRFPALVVRPSGVADIQAAVNFARDRELLVAVKCGGHSFSGKSTCDGGMQIDLSSFRHARVNPAKRRAWVAGGSLLGELDHEAMAHGLVTTAGTVSHTGVGGLTLGGGFGRLARRHGLALDNVLAAEVVTADGRLVRASAEENPDLYWGLRGGGGNFGVVTSFEFGLHPMERQVLGGSIVFPLARKREILDFYADYSMRAADDLYVDLVMIAPPAGRDGIVLMDVCYSGPASGADAALAPIRKLGTPLADRIRPQSYVELQKSGDRSDPRNEGTYLKSGFIRDFDSKMLAKLSDGFAPDPDRSTVMFFQHSGGAIGRVAADATAFPHRHAVSNMFAVASWNLDRDGAQHIRYIKDYWRTLEPFTDGYYTNEVADEGQKVIDSNYQGNISRLRKVKAKYDPGNLFRLNANVTPA